MSPRQVSELKTGKKCPRNGLIMAQAAGTRARERRNVGQRSGSRARMKGRWAKAHPKAQNEVRLQEMGLATHSGPPPTLLGHILSLPPLSPLFLAATHTLLHEESRILQEGISCSFLML